MNEGVIIALIADRWSEALGFALLAVVGTLAWRKSSDHPSLGFGWCALVFGSVVLCRWPIIVHPEELNPDEGQFLAAAMTFVRHPHFWKSVDSLTSGPPVVVALLPAAWIHGPNGYSAGRILAAAYIVLASLMVGQTIALIAGRRIARLSILPAILFEAFTRTPDFLFFSSEIVPVVMLSAAIFLYYKNRSSPHPRNVWLLGLLVGGLPWAKLQAAPLAIVLWVLVFEDVWRKRRGASPTTFVIASLIPSLVTFILINLTGDVDNLITSYFLCNSHYSGASPWTLSTVFRGLWAVMCDDRYLALWLTGQVIFVSATVWLSKARLQLRDSVLVMGLLAAVIATVLMPLRPFGHYLRFLEPVAILFAGIGLHLAHKTFQPALVKLTVPVFLILCACPIGFQRIFIPVSLPESPYGVTANPPSLIETIRRYSLPGDAMAIWGWQSSLYVECGLIQATRQAQSERQIWPSMYRLYFLRQYLADLIENAPAVFVDAVGPGNFIFEDRRWAHESFPPLNAWVSEHYQLVDDQRGSRVYIRSDRLSHLPPH